VGARRTAGRAGRAGFAGAGVRERVGAGAVYTAPLIVIIIDNHFRSRTYMRSLSLSQESHFYFLCQVKPS
jgi:hypothetical protein